MNTGLAAAQVSLLHANKPSHHSVSNHLSSPRGFGLVLPPGLPREGCDLAPALAGSGRLGLRLELAGARVPASAGLAASDRLKPGLQRLVRTVQQRPSGLLPDRYQRWDKTPEP